MTDSTAKAGESRCRGCETVIPAQPSGPGRPRVFCSVSCRRHYFHAREQAAIVAERQEQAERSRYELDMRFHGKREADRRARERARNRELRRNK
jgi:hypothetical protein